jgi:hypothetical protein
MQQRQDRCSGVRCITATWQSCATGISRMLSLPIVCLSLDAGAELNSRPEHQARVDWVGSEVSGQIALRDNPSCIHANSMLAMPSFADRDANCLQELPL